MSQIKTLTLSFMGKQYKWQRLFSTRLLVIYTGTYLLSTPVPDALTTQNNLHVYTTNGVYFYNIYFNQGIKKSDIGIHLYRALSLFYQRVIMYNVCTASLVVFLTLLPLTDRILEIAFIFFSASSLAS